MAKQIKFVYQEKEYVLEFTRKSIETLERQGFVASDITNKPVTTLPALFAGAFLANHRFIKKDVVDDIFNMLTNKTELIGKLAEMYNEPIMALIDEPEKDKGNLGWESSW